jgi:hypothetical protein
MAGYMESKAGDRGDAARHPAASFLILKDSKFFITSRTRNKRNDSFTIRSYSLIFDTLRKNAGFAFKIAGIFIK